MKKILSLFIVLFLLLNFTACNNKGDQEQPETTNETIKGKVTAINGKEITIAIISQDSSQNMNSNQRDDTSPEIQEGNNNQQGEVPPEIPEGNNNQQGEVPPEIPEGNGNGQESTPPEIPEGNNNEQGTTPPDIPEGNNNQQGEVPPEVPEENNNQQGEVPPEIPEGNNNEQGSTPPDKPEGNEQKNQSNITLTGETKTIEITDTSVLYKKDLETEVSASLTDIVIDSILTITYNEKSQITKILISSESNQGSNDGEGKGNNGGSSSEVIYSGAKEITTATTEINQMYTSETADQSSLLIDTSDDVTITNPIVTKSGDSDGGDNCNFYGQNATVLVKGGSETTITGGTITSDANGANGVFSYGGNGGNNGTAGDGTTVNISDTIITTTGNGSGGIMTTGGGITNATNLTITTSGDSSAAIRTDRGGGTVTVNEGTYTTNGLGSPSIYSTADITVTDAQLVSNLSEGICIEGLNSVELNNTSLTANNTERNGNAKFYDTIMIYQSMSGDSASGTSTFTMNGGSITSKNGHVFHVTNTSAVINLNEVTITNEDSDNILLSVCDDGWSGGSNIAVLNANNQTLNGAILVGNDADLTITLSNESEFTGYINGNIKNASEQTVSTTTGTVSITLSSNSTWTLTGDSYITSFNGNANNVISNGYTLYVNGVALTGTR